MSGGTSASTPASRSAATRASTRAEALPSHSAMAMYGSTPMCRISPGAAISLMMRVSPLPIRARPTAGTSTSCASTAVEKRYDERVGTQQRPDAVAHGRQVQRLDRDDDRIHRADLAGVVGGEGGPRDKISPGGAHPQTGFPDGGEVVAAGQQRDVVTRATLALAREYAAVVAADTARAIDGNLHGREVTVAAWQLKEETGSCRDHGVAASSRT